MTDVQLCEDGLTPADDLATTLAALEVLSGQVVIAVDVHDTPHCRVDTCRVQLLPIALLMRADQLDRPQPSWHPHQESAGEVPGGLRWLALGELRLRRVVPQVLDLRHVKFSLPLGRLLEELTRHPLVVSFRQGLLPSFCQHWFYT